MGTFKPAKRFLAWVALALVGGLAVHGAYWFFAAQSLQTSLETWIDQQRRAGLTLSHGTMAVDGYPLAFRIAVPEPFIADAAQGWSWQRDELTADTPLWRPWRLDFDLTGGHQISLPLGGRTRAFTAEAKAWTAALDFSDGLAVDTALDSLQVRPQEPGEILSLDQLDAQISLPRAAAGAAQAPFLIFDVRSRGWQLPPSLDPPLGPTIDTLELTGRVRGAVAAGPIATALAQWREGGGTIEFDRLAITHGPADTLAKGTLSLDRDLQPIGAFTARISGFFESLDILRNAHRIGKRSAVLAKVFLGSLARSPGDGGRPVITLPMSVQDRTLYVGPVGLVKIPFLNWQGQANEPAIAAPKRQPFSHSVFEGREDLSGKLLVASAEMKDPRFRRAVIYLIDHDEDGAFGLIINRLIGIESMDHILRQHPGTKNGGAATKPETDGVPMYYGGPVDQTRGFVLHTPDYQSTVTIQAGPAIAVTTDPQIIKDIDHGIGPRTI